MLTLRARRPMSAAWSATRRGPRIYVSFGTVFHRSAAFLTAARAAARLGGRW